MPREMMETPTPKKPEAQFHIWKETCAIRVGKKRAGHLLDGKSVVNFPKQEVIMQHTLRFQDGFATKSPDLRDDVKQLQLALQNLRIAKGES